MFNILYSLIINRKNISIEANLFCIMPVVSSEMLFLLSLVDIVAGHLIIPGIVCAVLHQ